MRHRRDNPANAREVFKFFTCAYKVGGNLAADPFGFDPLRDLRQQIANLVQGRQFAANQAPRGNGTHDVVMAGPDGPNSRLVRLSVPLHTHGEWRCPRMSRYATAFEQV